MIAAATSIAICRVVLIVISLGIWHWTQKLLARRNPTVNPPTAPGRAGPVGDTSKLSPVEPESAEHSAERLRLIRRLIDGRDDEENLKPAVPPVPRRGDRSRLVQRLLDGNHDSVAFLNDLLATMAVSVAGTEAAAFIIERDGNQMSLKNVAHIRPDDSDAATRAGALSAFQDLAKLCISQGKDGALEVGGSPANQESPQYCLITLLRDSRQLVAVACIITRCADLEQARQRLSSLQILGGYFDFRGRLRSATSLHTAPTDGAIADGIHRLTARINQRLIDNPKRANLLLIASSLVIDLLGIYLLVSAVIGSTIAPFLGLFMVFGLRQICQAFCPLPPPGGMIWRSPGVPSLLVTYGTSCDLFFSGHTAIAVYGCVTLASAIGAPGIAIGCAIVAFEMWTVLILRAHYTMDVFTGALAALYVHRLAIEYAPQVDEWIRHAASFVR